MKVIALVSGGKDSCFSMMECIRFGHEIVCLANLLPAQDEDRDIDSWMYQTVGHGLLGAYAACTGLPLLRRRIRGASVRREMAYEPTEGDEVEDLHVLLRHALRLFPDAKAVCSGAIASDYQRLRVEQVCARLGLVSLAYLWRRPQVALLRDIVEAGVHAVLFKTAAMGLSPTKHLGKTLAEAEADLYRLRKEYGNNVCGEGGEFETLVLDAPVFPLAKLRVQRSATVLHSPDPVCPVGLLHVEEYEVVPKAGAGGHAEGGGAAGSGQDAPRGGAVVWVEGEEGEVGDGGQSGKPGSEANDNEGVPAPHFRCALRHGAGGGIVHASATVWCEGDRGGEGEEGKEVVGGVSLASAKQCLPSEDVAKAVQCALEALRGLLSGTWTGAPAWPEGQGEPPAAAESTAGGPQDTAGPLSQAGLLHVYLRDMAAFGAANEAYVRVLPLRNPPSRACVQPALKALDMARSLPDQAGGEGVDLLACCQVDVILCAASVDPRSDAAAPGSHSWSPEDRVVEHVQSISTWAPACIGPYSQATALGPLVHFAGQIGLDPPTMTLVDAQHRRPSAAWLRAATAAAAGDVPPPDETPPESLSSEATSAQTQAQMLVELERCLLSCHAVALGASAPLEQSMLWCTVYHTGAEVDMRGVLSIGEADDMRGALSSGTSGLECHPAWDVAAVLRGAVRTLMRGNVASLSEMSPLDSYRQWRRRESEGGDSEQSSDEEAECLGGSGAKWATAGAGAGPAQAMEDDRRWRLMEELGIESDREEFWRAQESQRSRSWRPLEIWVRCKGLPRGARVEVQPVSANLPLLRRLMAEQRDSHSPRGSSSGPGFLHDVVFADGAFESCGLRLHVQSLACRAAGEGSGLVKVHVGIEGLAVQGESHPVAQVEAPLQAAMAAVRGVGLDVENVLLVRWYACVPRHQAGSLGWLQRTASAWVSGHSDCRASVVVVPVMGAALGPDSTTGDVVEVLALGPASQ